MQYTVYILETNEHTYYIGQTNNIGRRLKEHTQHRIGAKYLRRFSSFMLVYTELCSTRSEALKREYRLKQMTKLQKQKLISQKDT